VRITGTSENYLYSNKLSEDGGGSQKAINMPGGHHSNIFSPAATEGIAGSTAELAHSM